MVSKSIVQEISLLKHELKYLNCLNKGPLEYLSINCSLNLGQEDQRESVPFISRLRGEVLFIVEHILLQDVDSIGHVLKRYFLSDGSRLGLVGRMDISQIRGELRFKDGESGEVKQINFEGHRDDISLKVEENAFGKVDIVYENGVCGLYRLRLAPFAEIPVHIHKEMFESELVASQGLNLQGQPVKSGMSIQWPQDFPHSYINSSEHGQLVICIDKPAFMPKDEIVLAQDTRCPDLEENMVKYYW
ncbi:MAG: cupin domain-containing protein [Oligoflexales bacterium]